MTLNAEFTSLPLDRLRDMAHRMKDEGWRFIQTHAVYNEPDVDLYYSFMKDGQVVNYRIEGVTKEDTVPSITDIFLAAFVFENEARELFGVDMRDIAIDFQGGLYAPAENEPMRVITPEQKAAIDKARKAAAAKAAKAEGAKAAPAATDDSGSATAKPFKLSDEKRAKLEEKLATMDPAKAEKVRAALAAKEAASAAAPEKPEVHPSQQKAEEQAPAVKAEARVNSEKPVDINPERDSELENKIGMLSPEKAEKVRKALALRSGEVVEEAGEADDSASSTFANDAEFESKLSIMDKDKADKIREAMKRRASKKGGE